MEISLFADNQTMDQSKVVKLNSLFEKMVANNANLKERNELNHLYQEFINDGRDAFVNKSRSRRVNKVAMA